MSENSECINNNNNSETRETVSICKEDSDRCYNDHFNNPLEDNIPPHAPPPKSRSSSKSFIHETSGVNNNLQQENDVVTPSEGVGGENESFSEKGTELQTDVHRSQESFMEIELKERDKRSTTVSTTSSVTYTEAPSGSESKESVQRSVKSASEPITETPITPSHSKHETSTDGNRRSLIPVRVASTPADAEIRGTNPLKNPRSPFSSTRSRNSQSRGSLINGANAAEQVEQIVGKPKKEVKFSEKASKSLSSIQSSNEGKSDSAALPPTPSKSKRYVMKYPHDLWWWHPPGVLVEVDDDDDESSSTAGAKKSKSLQSIGTRVPSKVDTKSTGADKKTNLSAVPNRSKMDNETDISTSASATQTDLQKKQARQKIDNKKDDKGTGRLGESDGGLAKIPASSSSQVPVSNETSSQETKPRENKMDQADPLHLSQAPKELSPASLTYADATTQSNEALNADRKQRSAGPTQPQVHDSRQRSPELLFSGMDMAVESADQVPPLTPPIHVPRESGGYPLSSHDNASTSPNLIDGSAGSSYSPKSDPEKYPFSSVAVPATENQEREIIREKLFSEFGRAPTSSHEQSEVPRFQDDETQTNQSVIKKPPKIHTGGTDSGKPADAEAELRDLLSSSPDGEGSKQNKDNKDAQRIPNATEDSRQLGGTATTSSHADTGEMAPITDSFAGDLIDFSTPIPPKPAVADGETSKSSSSPAKENEAEREIIKEKVFPEFGRAPSSHTQNQRPRSPLHEEEVVQADQLPFGNRRDESSSADFNKMNADGSRQPNRVPGSKVSGGDLQSPTAIGTSNIQGSAFPEHDGVPPLTEGQQRMPTKIKIGELDQTKSVQGAGTQGGQDGNGASRDKPSLLPTASEDKGQLKEKQFPEFGKATKKSQDSGQPSSLVPDGTGQPPSHSLIRHPDVKSGASSIPIPATNEMSDPIKEKIFPEFGRSRPQEPALDDVGEQQPSKSSSKDSEQSTLFDEADQTKKDLNNSHGLSSPRDNTDPTQTKPNNLQPGNAISAVPITEAEERVMIKEKVFPEFGRAPSYAHDHGPLSTLPATSSPLSPTVAGESPGLKERESGGRKEGTSEESSKSRSVPTKTNEESDMIKEKIFPEFGRAAPSQYPPSQLSVSQRVNEEMQTDKLPMDIDDSSSGAGKAPKDSKDKGHKGPTDPSSLDDRKIHPGKTPANDKTMRDPIGASIAPFDVGGASRDKPSLIPVANEDKYKIKEKQFPFDKSPDKSQDREQPSPFLPDGTGRPEMAIDNDLARPDRQVNSIGGSKIPTQVDKTPRTPLQASNSQEDNNRQDLHKHENITDPNPQSSAPPPSSVISKQSNKTSSSDDQVRAKVTRPVQTLTEEELQNFKKQQASRENRSSISRQSRSKAGQQRRSSFPINKSKEPNKRQSGDSLQKSPSSVQTIYTKSRNDAQGMQDAFKINNGASTHSLNLPSSSSDYVSGMVTEPGQSQNTNSPHDRGAAPTTPVGHDKSDKKPQQYNDKRHDHDGHIQGSDIGDNTGVKGIPPSDGNFQDDTGRGQSNEPRNYVPFPPEQVNHSFPPTQLNNVPYGASGENHPEMIQMESKESKPDLTSRPSQMFHPTNRPPPTRTTSATQTVDDDDENQQKESTQNSNEGAAGSEPPPESGGGGLNDSAGQPENERSGNEPPVDGNIQPSLPGQGNDGPPPPNPDDNQMQKKHSSRVVTKRSESATKHTQAPDDFEDPPNIVPQEPLQNANNVDVKPSASETKYSQAPDDFYDSPNIVPQKSPSGNVVPEKNGVFAKPSVSATKHTQAPDDFHDSPIIVPQESPSENHVPEKKSNITYSSSVMPPWAAEFLATRCGKGATGVLSTGPPPFSPYRPYAYCCGSGNDYARGGLLGRSYCDELLSKYTKPPINSDGNNNKTAAPTPKPSKANTTKSNVAIPEKSNENSDDGTGCCKPYSLAIWILLLIAVAMLVYLIWWKECGVVVLAIDDITDWRYFPLEIFDDLGGVNKSMQLFLSTLGYFAYFILVCLCYLCCKTCAMPDDPDSMCSCKEIKLIIHIIYGAVLSIFLYLHVRPWKKNKKYGKKYNKKIDHVFECLDLCFWFTFVLLFLGIIAFIIYSLERKEIRKRIAPAPSSVENPPLDNQHQPQQRPRAPAATMQNDNNNNNNNNVNAVPAPLLFHSICSERTRPIFLPPRRVQPQPQFGFCQGQFPSMNSYGSWRNTVNNQCSCD